MHGDIGNPASSYIWGYYEMLFGPSTALDIVFSQCRFGTAYRKDTKLRCFGCAATELDKRCGLKFPSKERFLCGRLKSQGHVRLGFGAEATRPTAEYPQGVCRAYAKFLARLRCESQSKGATLRTTKLVRKGIVKRHAFRGQHEQSRKELRKQEDQDSLAGMRCPTTVLRKWPRLLSGMRRIRRTLLKARKDLHLVGLTNCCGKSPKRAPPGEDVLRKVRRRLEKTLKVDKGAFEMHHEASQWRFNLVKITQQLTQDPDKILSKWLEEGVPMGIERPIQAGGLFPLAGSAPEQTPEDLDGLERGQANHPSFEWGYDAGSSPGKDLLEEHLNAGYGELFKNIQDAEARLGGKLHPAPRLDFKDQG